MKKYAFISFMLLISLSSHAQFSRFSTGLHIMVDDALQSYGTNLETNPVGLLFTGLYHIPNSRFSLGSDVGVAMYRGDSYTLDLSDEGYANSYATVDEEDCYMAYSVFLRYDLLKFGPLTPYAQISLGGASFFSTKEYSDLSGSNAPESIESELEIHGTSLKTGIGAGIMLNFGQLRKEKRVSRISMDLGATINHGSTASYRSLIHAKSGTSTSQDNFFESNTHNVVYRMGVLYRF